MLTLTLQLPEDIETKLDTLAKATGRTKSFYVEDAILNYLDDLEDIRIAKQRLAELHTGHSSTLTLQEVKAGLGLDNQD